MPVPRGLPWKFTIGPTWRIDCTNPGQDDSKSGTAAGKEPAAPHVHGGKTMATAWRKRSSRDERNHGAHKRRRTQEAIRPVLQLPVADPVIDELPCEAEEAEAGVSDRGVAVVDFYI